MNNLFVVATPIGNLEDISIRAIRTLLTIPVIACEDTRRTGQLIKLLRDRYSALISNFQLPITKQKFISVRDFNEARMVEVLINELDSNDVALVSDAGTPLISDPGYKVVRAARQAGITVIPIPGPSAVTTALSAAGLPTNKFMFWGFLPKKWHFEPNITHVVYESAIRLEKTLNMIMEKHPSAEIVIANELTKIHERIMNYDLRFMNQKLKGEVTLLVYISE